MIYEYLIFNLLVLAGPFLAVKFYKQAIKPVSKPAFISIFIAAFIFLVWDQLVTDVFWQFNSSFIMGIRIGRLPVEEILFFMTVPWACLFLWVNFRNRYDRNKMVFNHKLATIMAVSAFGMAAFFGYLRLYYTASIFAAGSLVLWVDLILNTQLSMKKIFWNFLGITLILTFIWNGYLTWRPVVIYNPIFKTGINLLTIPVEDFIYGLALVSLVLVIYQFQENKSRNL